MKKLSLLAVVGLAGALLAASPATAETAKAPGFSGFAASKAAELNGDHQIKGFVSAGNIYYKTAPLGTTELKAKTVALDKIDINAAPIVSLDKITGLVRYPSKSYAIDHQSGAPWTPTKTSGWISDPLGLAIYTGAGQVAT